MAQVFDAYSEYYDLLYADKDYAAEARYVDGLIRRHGGGGKRILELGCGTGIHAGLLARAGYEVTGIDRSARMVELAKRHNGDGTVTFSQGDVRDFRSGLRYDAVLSLFHVASYLTGDEDLRRFAETASVHLETGGVFIFDYWYGPAVLTQRPEVRVKRVENERVRVVRVAEPELDTERNTVAVKYEVLVENKATRELSRFEERHGMRYLFTPEVRLLLGEHGLAPLRIEEWMSAREPSTMTWGVVCIAQRR